MVKFCATSLQGAKHNGVQDVVNFHISFDLVSLHLMDAVV